MTCIIGLEHDSKIYLGADSASSEGGRVRENRLPKVFERDAFLIGYTTSFRMGQILWQYLDVRAQGENETDNAYIICGFVEAARECFKEHGYATVENGHEEGGQFLVGHKGKLYQIGSGYGVTRVADGFNAVGCGSSYALAAMKALNLVSPITRIRRSLEIAAHFSAGVKRPFLVLQLP